MFGVSVVYPRDGRPSVHEVSVRERDAMHGTLDAKGLGLGKADLHAQLVASLGEQRRRQRPEPPQPNDKRRTHRLMLKLGIAAEQSVLAIASAGVACGESLPPAAVRVGNRQ